MIKNMLFILGILLIFSSCSSGQGSKKEALDYETLIKQGQYFALNNQTDSAIIFFNRAVKVEGNRIEAYYGLGFSYSQNCFNNRTDCNKAIEYFNKAEEIEPNFRRIYFNRALCKIKLLDYESAIDDLDKQILLDDSEADYFKNRAGCKFLLNDTIGACEDYRRSIELGNTYEQAWVDRICN